MKNIWLSQNPVLLLHRVSVNNNYCPQMKLRECYVFTRVCDSVPGGVSQHASPPGRHPPGTHPLWADTTPGRHPPGQTPSWADTPLGRYPPGQTPRRSMSGQYTSYWNTFLFVILFNSHEKTRKHNTNSIDDLVKQHLYILVLLFRNIYFLIFTI